MNGSLYPDGVLVDRSALRRTELTKAAEILRDRTTLSSRGIFSGGAITVGTPNTTINVAQLSGYAPNGEFIETAGSTLAISLDDYTPGVVNYVLAVYTEINDKLQPHESDGNTYATRSRAFYRIRVYSAANYAALLATDANLANDARDRALIIGTVLGAATVISANISMPIVHSNIMTSTPSECVSITGVTISSVSTATSEGSGTLTYVYPGNTITWTPPGGTVGAPVPLSSDAVYTVYDSGGIGGGVYLTLSVVYSQLPTTVGTITETIVIDNLYAQSIPRVTAEDWLHRNLIGTGIITENNPHGLSIDDLAGETLGQIEEHQDVMHCNGIFSPNGKATSSFIMNINTAPATGDILNITSPAATDLYYINGNKLSTATGTSIDFAQANFNSGAIPSGTTPAYQGIKTYAIYVNDVGVIYPVRRFEFPVTRTVSGVWIIDSNIDHPVGSFDLTVVAGATYVFTYGLGTPVTVASAIPAGDPEGMVIRLYAQSGYDWIDLYINRSANGLSSDDKLTSLAPGPHTDSITVSAAPDIDQNMRIGTVVYRWTSATGGVGLLGWVKDFLTFSNVGSFLDQRPFGTLCKENLSDGLLQDVIYNHNDELHHSGVLLNRDSIDGATVTNMNFGFEHLLGVGLNGLIRGGSYYLRGERKQKIATTTITFPISSTCLVYVNTSGTVTYLDVTLSTVQDGLAYLAGSSLYRNPNTSDYVSDDGQYSERGIPLYVVTTDGSTILTYRDVMRNINGPVDEWSVADRSEGLAAFDSLYSAFLWAEIYTSATYFDLPRYDAVNIKLTGLSSVDLTITQPASVNVYGNRNQVSFTTVPSTGTFMWVLGASCIVDGVRCVNSVVGTHDIFQIGSKCRIENCYYSSGVYNVGFAGDTGAVTRLDVKINNCEILTRKGFVSSSTSGSSLGWDISGNTITASEYSSDAYLISLYGGLHKIYNNIITLGDAATSTTNVTTGIFLNGNLTYNDSSIYGNKIYMGLLTSAVGSVGGKGILLNKVCSGVSIYGNRISRYPAATLLLSSGIVGSDTDLKVDNCSIVDNIIEDLPVGIAVVSATNPLNNLSISRNTISGTTSNSCSQVRGIYVSSVLTAPGNHSNVEITKNEIRNLTRQSANNPLATGATGCSAIYFKGEGFTEINNLSISDNSIRSISSTVATTGTTVAGIYVVLDNYVGSPIIQGLDISRNKISGLLTDVGVNNTDRYGIYVGYLDAGAASPYLVGFSIDNNSVNILATSVTTGSSCIGIYLNEPNYATSSVSYGSICNNVLRIANNLTDPSAYVGNGIYVTGQVTDSRISGNNIYSDSIGIYFDLTDSVVSENTIYTGGVGIVANSCPQTIMSHNNIKVKTVNAGLVSGSGVYTGCYCIYIPTGSISTNEDFTISDSILTLIGNGSPSTLIDYSANLNINKCSYFTIDGVTTKQSYTALTTTNNRAYHMYLYIGDLDTNRIQVNNCILDNWDGVPSTRSAYTSHALYFNSDATDPGTVCYGNVSVSNNVIYWPTEAASGNSGWRVASVDPVNAYAVHSDIIGCGLGQAFSYIRFMGNKVSSRQIAGVTLTRAPNAWFAYSPLFTCDSGGTKQCYSNTYTLHVAVASVVTSIFREWSSETVNV